MSTFKKVRPFVFLFVLLSLAAMACGGGGGGCGDTIECADNTINAATQVTNTIEALNAWNEKLFGPGGEPMCVYSYADGHAETKPCK